MDAVYVEDFYSVADCGNCAANRSAADSFWTYVRRNCYEEGNVIPAD